MNEQRNKFTALVVDDEPLARTHLVCLLNEAGVGRVLEAGGAAECLDILEEAAPMPHWAFLDVQMPEMNGIALADAIVAMGTSAAYGGDLPQLVFLTGYEEYAVQAFERAAVDYLLKPLQRQRLEVTLDRLASREGAVSAQPALVPDSALQRLPIRQNFSTKLLDIDEVVAAAARNKRVEVITLDQAYPTNYSLNQLEQRLPQERFMRVHDAWIVNLAQIVEVHYLGAQSYQIRLRSGGKLIPVSRRRMPVLQKRLGF